jgi:hypothetical protein
VKLFITANIHGKLHGLKITEFSSELVTICSPKGILESNPNCDKNGYLSLVNFIQRQ